MSFVLMLPPLAAFRQGNASGAGATPVAFSTHAPVPRPVPRPAPRSAAARWTAVSEATAAKGSALTVLERNAAIRAHPVPACLRAVGH